MQWETALPYSGKPRIFYHNPMKKQSTESIIENSITRPDSKRLLPPTPEMLHRGRECYILPDSHCGQLSTPSAQADVSMPGDMSLVLTETRNTLLQPQAHDRQLTRPVSGSI